MHLEFRVSCVEKISSFDAESFICIHQIQNNSQRDLHLKQRSLVKLREIGLSTGSNFRPQFKIQFVFENIVFIESSVFFGEVEHQQHEAELKTNGNSSQTRTKRYRFDLGEIVVASLPFFVAERDVKIRLIQLAPELSVANVAQVQAHFPSYFRLVDNSLCIGVAKICLRELLLINGGVSVTLQPKQSVVAAVEALNLNAIATSGMLGRDVGGSAVLTFQVFGVVFVRKLLMLLFSSSPCRQIVNRGEELVTGDNCIGDKNPLTFAGESGLSTEKMLSELREHTNSLAFRFVLVPYLVLIDALLRINDAVSWRHRKKTLFLFFIVLVFFVADMADFALLIFLLVEGVVLLRTATLFYRVMPRAGQNTGEVVSSAVGRGDFQPVLYGCHNAVLNSMVRAKLFFLHGLQADCFFELALIFYSIRRAKQWFFQWFVALVVAFFLCSGKVLTLLCLLGAFIIYPAMLRVSCFRPRKLLSSWIFSKSFWKVLRLSRTMRVSRVVLVTDAMEKRQAHINSLHFSPFALTGGAGNSANASTLAIPFQSAAEQLKQRCSISQTSTVQDLSKLHHRNSDDMCDFSELQGARIFGGFSLGDQLVTNAAINGGTRQARFSSKMMPWSCPEVLKHDAQQLSLLNFAVIVITMEEASVNNNKALNSSINSSSGNSLIVLKLRRVLQRARALDRPPPPNLEREQYHSYFGCVLLTLQFLRRQCSLKVYVTPHSSSASNATTTSPTQGVGGTFRLDHLAHISSLVEKGEDDGITSTLLAHSSQQVLLTKLQHLYHIENSARGLALLAAYLLQGSRLSIYNGTGNKGCAVIIPLKMGSNDIEVAMEPHPCPPSLQKALVDIWKGWTEGELPITINMDVVTNIIIRHKEFWVNEGDVAGTKPDNQHMCSPLREDSEWAKQFPQSVGFAPLFTCKERRSSSISATCYDGLDGFLACSGRQNSEMSVPISEDGKPIRKLGALLGGSSNYHRATQSWTDGAQKLMTGSMRHTVPVQHLVVSGSESAGVVTPQSGKRWEGVNDVGAPLCESAKNAPKKKGDDVK